MPHFPSQRLGLRRIDVDDESKLARPLLELMKDHRLDFHGTFRRLCAFRPSFASPAPSSTPTTTLEEFVESILTLTPEPERLDAPNARNEWLAWLRAYAARIESESDLWDAGKEGYDKDAERERAMRAANPRFVLRQWVLEEVIRRVEADSESGKRVLAKVLQVSTAFGLFCRYVRCADH